MDIFSIIDKHLLILIVVIISAPVRADDVAIPNTHPPTNHIEQQEQAALCATHAQGIIDRLHDVPLEQNEVFRRDVIAALGALASCRQQDVQAMKNRNNAEIGGHSKYSDL